MNINFNGPPFILYDEIWTFDDHFVITHGTCVDISIINGVRSYHVTIVEDNGNIAIISEDKAYSLLSIIQLMIKRLITPTPSVTPTLTRSPTRTPNVSVTISVTPSNTPTISRTAYITNTPTTTPTITPTISTSTNIITVTPTTTRTPSKTPSATPTISVTVTPSRTVSRSPGASYSVTPTRTNTPTVTNTPTFTPTHTAQATITPSITISPSIKLSVTPTSSITHTPASTVSPTITKTPSSTITPTSTVSLSKTPNATSTPTVTATSSITISPSVTKSVNPSVTPSTTISNSNGATPTPTSTVTQTPSVTASTSISITPTITPTITKSAQITGTPEPTITPTITQSITNSAQVTPTATTTITPTITQSVSLTPDITPTATTTITPTLTQSISSTPGVSTTPSITFSPEPTITPTITPSISDTPAVTLTATSTITPTVTQTISVTAEVTPTPTVTNTPEITPTSTNTPTISITPSVTFSAQVTETPLTTVTPSVTTTISISPDVTPTSTVTTTPDVTPTPTSTASISITPTISLTPDVTSTPESTITPTITQSITVSPTISLTPSITGTPGATATPTVTQSISITPSITQSAEPTITPTLTQSISISPDVTPTPTVTQSISITPSLTLTPTITETAAVTPTPSITASISISPTISITPSITETPAVTITPTITQSISITPSITQSAGPTVTPTITQSISLTPDVTPTSSITLTPTNTSTISLTPNVTPSAEVTSTPTITPTISITSSITETPSATITPTITPTISISPDVTVTPTTTITPTITQSISITPAVTSTPEATITPSITQSTTITPTITNSANATVTPTISVTPSITPSHSKVTPTPTSTKTISVTPSITKSISKTPAATKTPAVTPTHTSTNTATITVTPSISPSPSVTATPTLSNGATPPAVSYTTFDTENPCYDFTITNNGLTAYENIDSGSSGAFIPDNDYVDISTAKYYWEVTIDKDDTTTSAAMGVVGLVNPDFGCDVPGWTYSDPPTNIGFDRYGNMYIGQTTYADTVPTLSVGDTFCLAIINGNIYFGKISGGTQTWVGDPNAGTGAVSSALTGLVGAGVGGFTNGTYAYQWTANFGNTAWLGTIPTGCTGWLSGTISTSVTPTATPTLTPTKTITPTVTPTLSNGASATPTPTATLSITETPSITPSVTVSPSGGALDMYTAFNGGSCYDFTLSNNDLTVLENADTGEAGVQIIQNDFVEASTASYYWEITLDTDNSPDSTNTSYMGLMAKGILCEVPGQLYADPANNVGFDRFGNVYIAQNSASVTGPIFNVGDTVCLALIAGSLYAGKISGGTQTWVGDPNAGTGALATGLTGAYGPSIGGSTNDTYTYQWTANFGNTAWLGTIPTGCTGWLSDNAPPPSVTPTPSPTATNTPTATISITPSITPSLYTTPTPTISTSITPSASISPTPSITPTISIQATIGAPTLAAHPRLLLDTDTLDNIKTHYTNNTTLWQSTYNYYNSYVTGTISYPDGNAYPDTPNFGQGYQGNIYANMLVGFALIYQVMKDADPTTAAKFGTQAVNTLMTMSIQYPATHSQNPLTDDGYGIRYYGLCFGLGYDWLYDLLTSAQKTQIIGTANDWVNQFETGTFEYNSQQSNYFAGYFVAKTFITLATYEDNTSSLSKWQDLYGNEYGARIQPYYEQFLNKGGWPEGFGNYGPTAILNMTLPLIAFKTAADIDISSEYAFPANTSDYYIHFIWPNRSYMDDRDTNHANSDSSLPPVGTVDPNGLLSTQFLLNYLSDSRASLFRQLVSDVYTATGVSPTDMPSNSDAIGWYNLLFADSGTTKTALSTLPLSYLGGMGSVASRSSWDTTANWLSFRSYCYTNSPDQDEELHDQGSIAIVSGGNAPLLVNPWGWCIHEPNGSDDENLLYTDMHGDFSGSNVFSGNAAVYNIYYVRDMTGSTLNQRFGQSPNNYASGSRTNMAHEENVTFSYSLGTKLEDMYYAFNAGPGVQTWNREVVFLRPNIILVHDTTKSGSSSYDQYLAWATPVQTTSSGGRYSVTYNSKYLGAIVPVLPASTTTTSVAILPTSTTPKAYQLQVRASSPTQSTSWITMFDMAASGSTNTATVLTSTNADAVQVTDGTTYWYVAFATGSSVSYTTSGTSGTHIIAGLTANNSYNVTKTSGTISVVSGSTYTASANGVIYFTM